LIGGVSGPIDGSGLSISGGGKPKLGVGIDGYGAIMGCGNYRFALLRFK
jgi:hypothetical protein